MDPLVVYISLGVACASLAVAVTTLVLHMRGSHKVPVTSKLRREIRLGWQRLLPQVNIDTEHLLLRGESAHNNRAALLASLGVDVEVAEGEGVKREDISYLALVCSTLMVRSSRGKQALTDNFLEHRLLRRLFETKKLRRAWRFARKLAPPENREQIDEYLLHNYPREKWLLGIDEDGFVPSEGGKGDVTWGKGVVLYSRDHEDDELDAELEEERLEAGVDAEEQRARSSSLIETAAELRREISAELAGPPAESVEQIRQRSLDEAEMSLRAEAETHVQTAKSVLDELQRIARSRGSETVKGGSETVKGGDTVRRGKDRPSREIRSMDHGNAGTDKPGAGKAGSGKATPEDGPKDQAS